MLSIPDDPGWQVAESGWEPERNQFWESIFTIGNGYLGVRGFPEEFFDAGPSLVGTYVAGVFDPDNDGIPELVNVPNFFALSLELDGKRVQLAPGRVSEHSRRLCMRQGVLQRSFVYTEEGHSTLIQFERFASMTSPHIAGQRLSMTPLNWRGEVLLTFSLDAQVSNMTAQHLCMVKASQLDQSAVLLVTKTKDTHIRIAQAFGAEAWVHQTAPPLPQYVQSGQQTGITYTAELESGQKAMFQRTVVTYSSRDPSVESVEEEACKALSPSPELRYEAVRRAHTAVWQELWDSCDVRIDGPVEDQRAVRFAIYQLLQACSRSDGTVSIAAKAMTGEGYRGHVFWDTEVFMLPFFIYTQPEGARRLLAYRAHTLPGARRKAKENGYQGAMFAWESADTGDETCPRYVPDPKTGEPVRVWTGELEQHISAMVTYGGWHYWQASGDEKFCQTLAEIAIETARFWASRVTLNEKRGRYEILDVIGPDEYHEHVDNNAFTNYVAAWNLRLAARLTDLLARDDPAAWEALRARLKVAPDEPETWLQFADRIYIPFDEARQIHVQHEGFFDLDDIDPKPLSVRFSREPEKVRMPKVWKSQVLKQADVVMLMMLLPDVFSMEVRKNNWDYYEPRTTHDSSLSASIHAIVAADLGLREEAYEYFRATALTDLEDRHGNTDQGLHAAALGGTWQVVVRGFLGLRASGEMLTLAPNLPEAWQSVACKLHYQGNLYEVRAEKQRLSLTLLEGSESAWVEVANRKQQVHLGQEALFTY